MDKPYFLTLYTPNPGGRTDLPGEDARPIILESLAGDATVEGQAKIQNRLAIHGSSETLLAERPIYWQRRLVRALATGFAFGLVAGVVGALIFS